MGLFVWFLILAGCLAPDAAQAEDQYDDQRKVARVRCPGEHQVCGDLHGEGGYDEENGQDADDFFDFHGMSFLFSTLQTYETIFEKQIIFIEFR